MNSAAARHASWYSCSLTLPVQGARHSPMCQSRHSRVARMVREQVRTPYTDLITRTIALAERLPPNGPKYFAPSFLGWRVTSRLGAGSVIFMRMYAAWPLSSLSSML